MDNDNVISLASSKDKAKDDSLPQFDFVIETVDGVFKEVFGFPVFSPQYIMIMREFGNQTMPVYAIPLSEVKSFELDSDEDFEEEDTSA